jgi:3-oxoacyl-[acyl-carrier protein] reductase
MNVPMKFACITGAARGIGLAYVHALLKREQWSVAILDVKGAGEVASELSKSYGNERIIGLDCNVADKSSFKRAFDSVIEKFGSIDLFVNNAGIMRFMFSDAEDVIAVNLVGAIRGTEWVIKHATNGLTTPVSRPNGLLVVSTASTNGLIPADPDMAPVYVVGISLFLYSLQIHSIAQLEALSCSLWT